MQVLGLEALAGQVGGHAAHALGDGHTVVVEDDNDGLAAAARIGQALKGQAAGESAVPDEGQHAVIFLVDGAGPGHAQGHGHRVGGVACHKGVRPALVGLGEAGQTAELPQGVHGRAPPGEELVGVALVAHVKDQTVHIQVKDPVHRHQDLHHAQTGGQVSPGLGDRLDHLHPQLLAQLSGLLVCHLAVLLRQHAAPLLPVWGYSRKYAPAVPTTTPRTAPAATCSGV